VVAILVTRKRAGNNKRERERERETAIESMNILHVPKHKAILAHPFRPGKHKERERALFQNELR
jgi:hypothetical protein